jgi:hypothetical protein
MKNLFCLFVFIVGFCALSQAQKLINVNDSDATNQMEKQLLEKATPEFISSVQKNQQQFIEAWFFTATIKEQKYAQRLRALAYVLQLSGLKTDDIKFVVILGNRTRPGQEVYQQGLTPEQAFDLLPPATLVGRKFFIKERMLSKEFSDQMLLGILAHEVSQLPQDMALRAILVAQQKQNNPDAKAMQDLRILQESRMDLRAIDIMSDLARKGNGFDGENINPRHYLDALDVLRKVFGFAQKDYTIRRQAAERHIAELGQIASR